MPLLSARVSKHGLDYLKNPCTYKSAPTRLSPLHTKIPMQSFMFLFTKQHERHLNSQHAQSTAVAVVVRTIPSYVQYSLQVYC